MSPLLTSEDLVGVHAKLERADESIRNLNAEITAFLKDDATSAPREGQHEAVKEWMEAHGKRSIPPRFGVLAGEIAHHLRTSLDHVAWILFSESYRRTNEIDISFPILTSEAATENEISRYKRKVKGIASADALKIIESIQPYHAGNPFADPLAVVNELDRIDKHHALVLVIATFDMGFEIPKSFLLASRLPIDLSAYMNDESYAKQFDHKIEIKVTKQVAFASIGQGKNQAVIPLLTHLAVQD